MIKPIEGVQRQRDLTGVVNAGLLLLALLFLYYIIFVSPDVKIKSPIPAQPNYMAVRAQERPAPTQSATPTPDPLKDVSASMPLDEALKLPSDIVNLYIDRMFGAQAGNAHKIQQCENGAFIYTRISGNSDATRSVDVGLYQVNSIHRKEVEAMYGEAFEVAMIHPIKNIDYTFHIFETQGWTPWYSSRGCHGIY